MIVPAWINPGFQLIDGDRSWDWPALAAFSEDIRSRLPSGSRIAVTGRSVATLLAALIACERARVELVMLRGEAARPAGASLLIEPDGRFAPLSPSTVTTRECAILLPTSGTTGTPKLVRHDLIRIIGRVRGGHEPDARWLLTYEPTAFAGLQVIFNAVSAGATLIAHPGATPPQLAQLMAEQKATHVSATPSIWRWWLRLPQWQPPALNTLTLGGEAADQTLLDQLTRLFPTARRRDIYASTEAGVIYILRDGKAGFPAAWLDTGIEGVGLRIADGVLEVHTPRAMLSYAGGEKLPFTRDGWLVTGDLVERMGKRVYFAGRADAQVAVDGVTVAPERIEQFLLQVPGVQEALVRPMPFLAAAEAERQPRSGLGAERTTFNLSLAKGATLGASVIAAPGIAPGILEAEIGRHFASLPPAEQPHSIRFVESIDLTRSGKKARRAA